MILVQSLHWLLALVPVLVLLAIFISFDVFKLMNVREILLLLALGGIAAIAAYPVSGRLLDTLPIGFSNYSRFVAPWIEEGIKAVVIIGLFRFNQIGFKIDAVLAGFAVGAGFSVVENIIYLAARPEFGATTWLVRGLGTAVMHGTTLAILAATAHEFAERETREKASDFNFNLLWFVPGYLIAVALHLAFNQLPDRPLLAMLGASVAAPIAIVLIFQFGSAEAQQWLEQEYAEHKAQYDALKGGHWPESESGRRIAKFAERFDEQIKERIRHYWEIEAWLVLQAEETLLEEAAGDVEYDPEAIRRAFRDRDTLREDLGRIRLAALEKLLPFSRNDEWEVGELRERLQKEQA